MLKGCTRHSKTLMALSLGGRLQCEAALRGEASGVQAALAGPRPAAWAQVPQSSPSRGHHATAPVAAQAALSNSHGAEDLAGAALLSAALGARDAGAPLPEDLPPELSQLLLAWPPDAAEGGPGGVPTWRSHLISRQEDARVRSAVAASRGTRGRQRRRQLLSLLEAYADVQQEGEERAASSSAAAGPATARPGSGGPQAPALVGLGRGSAPPGQAPAEAPLEDLTWLASHPPEEELREGARGSAAGGAAPAPAASWQSAWAGGAAVHPDGSVSTAVGERTVLVRPLWICVHMDPEGEAGGATRLYESVVPLQPEVVARVGTPLEPFCTLPRPAGGHGALSFSEALCDSAAGPWRNYYVGVAGDVAAAEDEILWPNQVLYRDRVLYNVRGAHDVAAFLADPSPDDVRAHLANLRQLAAERGYRAGWCWHMLRARWGAAALTRLGVRTDE